MVEILLFAVLSVYLFYRLWSVLGTRTGQEKQRQWPRPENQDSNVIILPQKNLQQPVASIVIDVPQPFAEQIKAIQKTFKDFSNSAEKIAPGILSSRLKWLEENELITKRKLPDNQKENVYLLTEKGIGLAPLITEIVLWSGKNLIPQNAISGMIKDKSTFTEGVQNNYRKIVQSLIG